MKQAIIFICECGNTHPDQLSAKLCAEHDKMLSIRERARRIVMAQPPGKTRAMPNKAKKKPTTTAAKKRKKPTRKA